jgi:hypothetical protein
LRSYNEYVQILTDYARKRTSPSARGDNVNSTIQRLIKLIRDARKLPEQVEREVIHWLEEFLDENESPPMYERILGPLNLT